MHTDLLKGARITDIWVLLFQTFQSGKYPEISFSKVLLHIY